MKKLVLLVYVLLIASSGRAQKILESLNGYNQQDAFKMIKHFQDVNAAASTLKPTSVWISKDIFKAINNLLKNEKVSRANEGLPPPDGIRIYFASDPATNMNSVIIVSTYNTGIKNPVLNQYYHEDYYEHLSADPLFNLKDINGRQISINGLPCYDGTCSGGAQLYTHCDTCKDDTTCVKDSHYLTRIQCENMAQSFGKFKVTTLSEWYEADLIDAIANDDTRPHGNPLFDGVRIYFGRHPGNDGTIYPFKDAFVLVTTRSGFNPDVHTDYFDCTTTASYFLKRKAAIKRLLKGGSDNGELCPDNCTLP